MLELRECSQVWRIILWIVVFSSQINWPAASCKRCKERTSELESYICAKRAVTRSPCRSSPHISKASVPLLSNVVHSWIFFISNFITCLYIYLQVVMNTHLARSRLVTSSIYDVQCGVISRSYQIVLILHKIDNNLQQWFSSE